MAATGRIGDGGGLSSLHLFEIGWRLGGCCRAAGDVCGDLIVRSTSCSCGGDDNTVAALKDASCDTNPILGNAWKNTCNFGRGGLELDTKTYSTVAGIASRPGTSDAVAGATAAAAEGIPAPSAASGAASEEEEEKAVSMDKCATMFSACSVTSDDVAGATAAAAEGIPAPSVAAGAAAEEEEEKAVSMDKRATIVAACLAALLAAFLAAILSNISSAKNQELGRVQRNIAMVCQFVICHSK